MPTHPDPSPLPRSSYAYGAPSGVRGNTPHKRRRPELIGGNGEHYGGRANAQPRCKLAEAGTLHASAPRREPDLPGPHARRRSVRGGTFRRGAAGRERSHWPRAAPRLRNNSANKG